MGARTQLQLPTQFAGRRIPTASETSSIAVFCLVFNGLRDGATLEWRRFRNTSKYLQIRAFVLLRDEWFGPSFVTIMPTGVWVCSF